MKMKRINIVFLMALFVFNMSVNAQDILDGYQDVMYFRTLKSNDANSVELSLCLKNSSFAVKSLQCTVVLPQGVSFVSDESGFKIDKTDIIDDNWTLIARQKQSDPENHATILLYNAANNDQISLGNTVIASMPLVLTNPDVLSSEGVYIKDVTLTGADLTEYSGDSYVLNFYKLTYLVDGVAYKTIELKPGDTITAEPDPTEDGSTFSGWSVIPATMPAHDVEVTGSFSENILIGDVNDDGDVDISDYIGVANYILGKAPSGFNETAADINSDGTIDISDYIGVANIILKGEP